MTVKELSREQLNELKESYAIQLSDCGELEEVSGISYGELLESKNIPDEVIFNHYDGVTFTEDDFFCGHDEKEEE